MQDFEFLSPKTIEEAVSIKAAAGNKARALAGGTDVLVQLKVGRFDIDQLIDMKNIPELNELSFSESDGLTIGAAVPCYKIYEDPTVRSSYPCIVDSSELIGSIQIQGRASLGGNVVNSSPSGDSLPSLIALNGSAVIQGTSGTRSVPLEEFFTGPGRNVMTEDELLVSLNFPAPSKNSGAAFLRFIPRNEMDIAVANVASSVTLTADGKNFESARISIGAVGPTPYFAKDAGDLLAGQEVNDENIAKAAEAAKKYASPITDMRGTIEQRIHLVGVLTKRTLDIAIQRARG
ncbi:MAG: carbon monoxide dehydrogenase [Chloroflexi bacterium]|nr:carbon monoxide dehydrogenase [Chloroflexota bacterium]